MHWVQKISEADRVACLPSQRGILPALCREQIWKALIAECRRAVDTFEAVYHGRSYWITEPLTIVGRSEPHKTIYRAALVEHSPEDRPILELRFETAASHLSFWCSEPDCITGTIELVLDESNEIRMAYQGQLVEPVEMARILLAPPLFRVYVHHTETSPPSPEKQSHPSAPADSKRPPVQPAAGEITKTSGTIPSQTASTTRAQARSNRANVWKGYLFALSAVALSTGMVSLLRLNLPFPLILLFATACGWCFVRWGIGSGLTALVLATLSTDFFFIEPIYQLTFSGPVWALGMTYTGIAVFAYLFFVKSPYGPILKKKLIGLYGVSV